MPLRPSLAIAASLALAACSDSDGTVTSGPSDPSTPGQPSILPINLPDTGTLDLTEGEGMSGTLRGGVTAPTVTTVTLGTEGGDITQIASTGEGVTLSVDTLNGTVTPEAVGVDFEDPDQDSLRGTLRTGILAASGVEAAPLEYMVYGAWFNDDIASSARSAAVHAGYRTPVGDMPTSGSATYTGTATGVEIRDAGLDVTRTEYEATVQLSTSDFEDFSFTTSGSRVGVNSDNSLNLIGTLERTGNTLSGSISAPTALGGGTGQASARFYGPGAEELGGVYAVQFSGPDRNITASFGASRDPQFSPLN